MKTQIIWTIVILLMVVSACRHTQKEDAIQLMQREIVLPNDETGHLIVLLSQEENTYIIIFDTDDKSSLIKFSVQENFYTDYFTHCADSLIVSSNIMSTQSITPNIRVSDSCSIPGKLLKHHTIVDVLAKTYLSTDKFQSIAKIEFLPDNYFHPTKIEKIILWEARAIYQDNKTKKN